MDEKPLGRRQFLGLAAILAAGTPPVVLAKKKLRWKMVTTWPKNFPGLGTGANHLAKTITELSQGEIQVKVYGAGELVPALGIFDAVSRGTAQLGHGVAYYWKGKHEASQFFGAVPFGLTAVEMNGWLHHGGGQKLWDELYGGFGLKAFAAGNTGVQMGGWFNKPLNSVSDLKGLKMRIPGLGGEVLRKLGVTVVTLPGGEIFQSLKSGAIDASEWVGPYNDLAFGFHKAAKYYYGPGWQEPGPAIECMVNKKALDGLSAHLKKVIEVACASANDAMLAEFTARNGDALNTLVQKHKVQLKAFPEDVLSTIGKTSEAVVSAIAAKDAFTKRVYGSYSKFRKKAQGWNQVSEQAYGKARGQVMG